MKSIKLSALALTAIVVLASCKKKTETADPVITPATANVTINFANEVDGQPIELGKMKYTNAAGNMYQVDLLKYYVTNIILVKSDNTELNLGNYDLIDASNLATCKVDGASVPNATYTKIKFNVGVPPSRNHTGAQDGDLDPILGMIWDWNTGYVFFKHEGKYINSSSQTKNLAFHLATDRAFTSIEVPLSTSLVVNGTDKKVYLKFNLNKLYTTPVNIDFNVDNSHQSTSSSDFQWIDNMKSNFTDVFSLDKIE